MLFLLTLLLDLVLLHLQQIEQTIGRNFITHVFAHLEYLVPGMLIVSGESNMSIMSSVVSMLACNVVVIQDMSIGLSLLLAAHESD